MGALGTLGMESLIGFQDSPHIARLMAVFGGVVGRNVHFVARDRAGYLALGAFKFFSLNEKPFDLGFVGADQGMEGSLGHGGHYEYGSALSRPKAYIFKLHQCRHVGTGAV